MEPKSLKYLKWGFVFLFFHITFVVDLLPDFAGVLLLHSSIQEHKRTTEAEDRIKPLLLVLAVDYFLHWIFPFEFLLENLLMTVISMYAMYVLLGEVAGRILGTQPERAKQLNTVRVLMVLSQVLNFVVSAYGNEGLNGVLVLLSLGILIALLVVVCKIEPSDEKDSGDTLVS